MKTPTQKELCSQQKGGSLRRVLLLSPRSNVIHLSYSQGYLHTSKLHVLATVLLMKKKTPKKKMANENFEFNFMIKFTIN